MTARIALAVLLLLLPALPLPADDGAAVPPWEAPVTPDAFNPEAAGPAAPVTGGTLTVALAREPKALAIVLDPDPGTDLILGLFAAPLVDTDPVTGEPRMRLAESMTVEDLLVKSDGTQILGRLEETTAGVRITAGGAPVEVGRDDIMEIRRQSAITFQLRKNAQWHDGKPVTAGDVQFTFRLTKMPEILQPVLQRPYEDVGTCEALDDRTVRFMADREAWSAARAVGGIRILPRHVYDPKGLQEKNPMAFWNAFQGSPALRDPVGSGPYKVVKGSWKKGDRLELERNAQYADPGRAGHVDRIVVRFIPDPAAALAAAMKGEVDFVPGLPDALFQAETAKADFPKTLAPVVHYYPNVLYLGWNNRIIPFNDPGVRKALALGALDLEAFNKTELGGSARVVTGPQDCFGPFYDAAVKPPKHDPKEAAALLTAAGWKAPKEGGVRVKDKNPLKITLAMPKQPPKGVLVRLAARVQGNLKRLGAEVIVEELPEAVFIDHIEHLEFSAALLSMPLGREEDPILMWHSAQTGGHTHNHVGFGGPETDALIEESRRTFDPAKRAELVRKLHARIAEAHPCVFLYTRPDYAVYRKAFRGVRFFRAWPGWDLTEWFLPAEAGK